MTRHSNTIAGNERSGRSTGSTFKEKDVRSPFKKKKIIESSTQNSSESSRRTFNPSHSPVVVYKNQKSGFPNTQNSIISSAPLTPAHFLDAYSKGKWNLSSVPCPPCFHGIGLMKPPESYNESIRLRLVHNYMDYEQWKDTKKFTKLISNACRNFQCFGASISLIDQKRQIAKYQHSFGITECPRSISIDAHALLSLDYFLLLDATKDWRFENNPFVKGMPNIRFYVGVPLLSKLGIPIGVFSIFDVFPRYEFDQNQLSLLKNLAQEVMEILNSPFNPTTTNKLNQNCLKSSSNTEKLINKIGRPTSYKLTKLLTNVPVFEKDGSGSQYSQNHNFRLSKSQITNQEIEAKKVWKLLFDAGQIKFAANLLCEHYCKTFSISYAFIMEIRIAETYQIPSNCFPVENKIDAENFKFANQLQRIDKEKVITKVLGSHCTTSFDDKFNESNIYYRSLSSEFGILIKSKASDVKFTSGVCMCFHRLPSKLVRKKRIHIDEKNKNTKNISSKKPIELYLRSGGFLVAAFNENDRNLTENEISGIFEAACIYRKIYITN
ncbi:GAF domain-containing protein ASCRUDRAFT_5341 [Ascoidea rubescens DSM 1968]|uniref:GAF domain-containing protein n=1 Tax=Ascoidea rubescens DSM 1968 TaxID=1344418 RepID=A0A1D2VP46_9ASCO|nr:hypothetical protein ASCRUDRAFT_5341 [Ascoidea rubescens DSM 1968]ODV63325.1 hypothetical protein ASCRUDRAFT_5341 [Ascoidea rubescens DSM 1968]